MAESLLGAHSGLVRHQEHHAHAGCSGSGYSDFMNLDAQMVKQLAASALSRLSLGLVLYLVTALSEGEVVICHVRRTVQCCLKISRTIFLHGIVVDLMFIVLAVAALRRLTR